ncbi:MAG: YceI family protein [Myxococcota bacterium]
MPEYGSDEARCAVDTRREGLLSPVGHDLRLEVEVRRLRVEADSGAVEATFDPSSVKVLGALEAGRVSPVGKRDARKIEKRTREEVLEARRFPEIAFRGEASRTGEGAWEVDGTLSMHGRERRVRAPVRMEGARLVARVALRQPDYGIAPVSALMGALKVHPEVVVEVSVPADAGGDVG